MGCRQRHRSRHFLDGKRLFEDESDRRLADSRAQRCFRGKGSTETLLIVLGVGLRLFACDGLASRLTGLPSSLP
jgi:hypothetical protein